jgi:hypothetical protein
MSQYQQVPGTPKEILRSLRVFFGAIITGAVVFAIIMVVVIKLQGHVMPETEEYQSIFLYVAAGLATLCWLVAVNQYNKGIAAAKDSLILLPAKLNLYRSALIRYVALCEAPALFGIIVFFMTANYIALGITGVMIIAMLAKTPTLKRVADDLSLDRKQQQELE